MRRRSGQDGFALHVRSGTIRVGLALLLAQILDSGRRVRKQQFSAALPNTVWLADIASLPTGEGWLYLAAVLDLATRKIVGWSMRAHMRTDLTSAALMTANQQQQPGAGLICHSDRGSQYAAEAYRAQFVGMKAIASTSPTGWGTR